MAEATMVQSPISLSSPSKRKREDAETMPSDLRAEAAKVVRKRLGHEKYQITFLIEKGANQTDSQSVAREPDPKRLRGALAGNGSKASPEAVVQTERENVSEQPQPKVTSIAIQTASSTQIARRCSLQPQSSNQQVTSPDLGTTTRPQVPKLTTPTPPRTMSLNTNGILEVDPMPPPANPSPTFPVAAPIPASPFTLTPLTPCGGQSGANRDEEQAKNTEKMKIAVMDMENQMRAWMSHATNGYLAVPNLRSEIRALKQKSEETESILRRELEEKTKLLWEKEERTLSLETKNVKLEKEIEDLRENANAQKEEWDSMQDRISTLEQELSGCRTTEKNLRHSESVVKDCYQRLGVEHDKLKESTDLDAKKSKETIDALEKTQSELEERLKVSTEAYASKEVVFGDTIMSLMAEKELIHNSLLEKNTFKLLQNVIKYQKENNSAAS
ncbi:hypothetical protein TWF481_002822 [Arthrobotrys musiformis]|uniref:Uncharacterized protein n=1 Tax=Arthrobotrys musiformis TaxID=47236 RepID=A0AAV9VTA3_9PEZI